MLIPPRHVPKIILATAFAPLVVKNIRPIAKAAGKGLVKAGELIQKLADEAAPKKPPVAETMHAESVEEEPTSTNDSPVGSVDEAVATTEGEVAGIVEAIESEQVVEPEVETLTEPDGTRQESETPNEA